MSNKKFNFNDANSAYILRICFFFNQPKILLLNLHKFYIGNLQSGSVSKRFLPYGANHIVVSNNDQFFALANDDRISLYDTNTLALLSEIRISKKKRRGSNRICKIVFLPNNKYLAATMQNSQVLIWHICKNKLKICKQEIQSVFCDLLYIKPINDEIHITKNGFEKILTYHKPHYVTSMQVSANQKYIISLDNQNSIYQYDVDSDEHDLLFPISAFQLSFIYAIVISPNNKLLAIAIADFEASLLINRRYLICNLTTKEIVRCIKDDILRTDVQFSHCGRHLAAFNSDLCLWSIIDYKLIASFAKLISIQLSLYVVLDIVNFCLARHHQVTFQAEENLFRYEKVQFLKRLKALVHVE